ncbi:hypothetical protein [Nocardia thraciensis]
MLVAVFNAAIALGALLGGRAVDGFGPTAALCLGALLAVAAGAAAMVGSPPRTATSHVVQ